MAKPDLDDGWFMLAHELDAALDAADFTKAARVVLREVKAQIFGPRRLRVATISPSEIARGVGRPRQFGVRGVAELVASRALLRVAEGTYRFAKDYESWTWKDGSPRLTPDEVAWAKSAPERACFVTSREMSHKRSSDISLDVKVTSREMSDDISLDVKIVPPPDPPYKAEEGRRKETPLSPPRGGRASEGVFPLRKRRRPDADPPAVARRKAVANDRFPADFFKDEE